MNKHLTTPHERNSRTEHPIGLLGIPPPEDEPRLPLARERLRIIVIEADEQTAEKIMTAIDKAVGRRKFIWPQ